MRRSTSQRGETLIEILISVVLIGLIVATILPEYFTASVASSAHRNFVVADQLLRNNAEAVKSAVRRDCGQSSTYTTTTTSLPGFSCQYNLESAWAELSQGSHTGPAGEFHGHDVARRDAGTQHHREVAVKAPRRDEAGATLVLVLAFLVLIGVVGSAMLSSVTSGLNGRQSLDAVRDREYAADGAIESAIATVRDRMTGAGSALFPCANPLPSTTLNQITVQVDCTYTPAMTTSGYWQRNVIFIAHCPTGSVGMSEHGSDHPRASELRVAFRDRPHADRRQGHDDPVVERRPVNDRRGEDGLTLIELVISIVLMTMIAGALGAAFLTAATSSRQTAGRVRGSNDAQVVAAFLTRDAQSAGGVDPLTGLTDQSLGVFTDNLASGNPCRVEDEPGRSFPMDRSFVDTYPYV